MKKFRKIMAVLVAAMMIMATMVPAWAEAKSGVLGTQKGQITIKNVKEGEKYSLYRLFDLASFDDSDNSAEVHNDSTATPPASEAYSYVVRGKWYEWLTDATRTGGAYAVAKGADWTSSTAPATNQLFWVEPNPVTLKDDAGTLHSDYYVITATTNFSNAYDITASGTNPYNTTDYNDATTSDKTRMIKKIQDFAQDALAYAGTQTATNVNKISNASLDVAATAAQETSGIVIASLPIGYYLLGSTEGTLCSLDTTNLNVDIFDKNDEPTIEKKVLPKTVAIAAQTDADWVEDTDGDIGDTVYFRTKITAKQGAKSYKLHDVMEEGLTFGAIYSVTLTRDAISYSIPAKQGLSTNWTLVGTPTDNCDFQIEFAGSFVDGDDTALDIKDNDIITVIYSTTINDKAAIFGLETANNTDLSTVKLNDAATVTQVTGNVPYKHNNDQRNTNHTVLTYGLRSQTVWDNASVTTYRFDVVKTKDVADGSDKTYDLLNGASFSLYKVTNDSSGSPAKTYTFGGTTYYGDGIPLTFTKDDTTDSIRDIYTYNSSGAVDDLVSTATKAISVRGLEATTYVLVEDTAPVGYNKLSNPILITITGGDGTGGAVAGTNEGTITTVFTNNYGNSTTANMTTATNKNAVATVAVADGETATSYNTDASASNGGIHIINTTGEELPNTGGMGTTVLYIVGGMLVILAGAYLFFSRKKTA